MAGFLLAKFDPKCPKCYTMGMLKRKRRSDTNHAVYTITNLVTGEYYIGITEIGRAHV